ncbi:copper transport protein ATOX1 [Strix uralensis]|uniref:copper transport protein ATOX1 n=2 Tax=Strigidae TaxID=30459 RepID=UPI003DA24FC0
MVEPQSSALEKVLVTERGRRPPCPGRPGGGCPAAAPLCGRGRERLPGGLGPGGAAGLAAAPGTLCGAGAQGPALQAQPRPSGARRGPPLPPRRAESREPPPRSAMPKHEFFVDMTCEGCSNAVTRVLHRLGGVQFDIDLPNKKVCIDSEHSVDTLLETLKKTGKNASYLGEKSAQ